VHIAAMKHLCDSYLDVHNYNHRTVLPALDSSNFLPTVIWHQLATMANLLQLLQVKGDNTYSMCMPSLLEPTCFLSRSS
jgi:hypothetical protein